MGDYANNMAMAKRGIPEMSMTAVFGESLLLGVTTSLSVIMIVFQTVREPRDSLSFLMPSSPN